MEYDVVIVGGGPAGMSAALWCHDLGMNAALLEAEKEFGGQLLRTYNPVENHLGKRAENGVELRDRFAEQIEDRKFARIFQASVESIDPANLSVKLADGRNFFGKRIIIAAGVGRRKLGVPGEIDFAGKGMLVSGKLDADKAAGKIAAVVGGGDAAMENALILSEHAEKVFLIHRRKELWARPEFLKRLRTSVNIVPVFDAVVKRIGGLKKIESIDLEHTETGELRRLMIDVCLVRIGVEPNSGFLKDTVQLDENGYVLVNRLCQSSVPEIFAIGDIANPISPTVSTAVGMGATAAKAVRWSLSD